MVHAAFSVLCVKSCFPSCFKVNPPHPFSSWSRHFIHHGGKKGTGKIRPPRDTRTTTTTALVFTMYCILQGLQDRSQMNQSEDNRPSHTKCLKHCEKYCTHVYWQKIPTLLRMLLRISEWWCSKNALVPPCAILVMGNEHRYQGSLFLSLVYVFRPV